MNKCKKWICNALIITSFGIASSCAHLNSISLTQIPKNRKHQISAEATRWIFLGLNFDNDYVDQVTDKLKQQCRNGKVTGILTKFTTHWYWILFKNTIQAQGFCLKGKQV